MLMVSMNPKYLKEMLEECKNKDLVFTSRYDKPLGGSDDDDFVTFIGNKFFFIMWKYIFVKLNISDILITYIIGKTHSFKKP